MFPATHILLAIPLLLVPSGFGPVGLERATRDSVVLEHEMPDPVAALGPRVVVVRLANAQEPERTRLTLFIKQNEREWRREPMIRPGNGETWSVELPVFPPGSLVHYRIEAELASGDVLQLPEGKRAAAGYRYVVIADVPPHITWLRDGALWISFLFGMIATVSALRAPRPHYVRIRLVQWSVFFGVVAGIAYFIGAVCLSWIHSFYATGTPWATLARGRNHIPYASLILTAYWALVIVSFREHVLYGRKPPTDRVAVRCALAFGLGTLGILTFLALGLGSP